MGNDLKFPQLKQLMEALSADDPELGEGGVIVVPEPIWGAASEEDHEAFTELAESHGFQYRIERRWQRRTADRGITRMSVERNKSQS